MRYSQGSTSQFQSNTIHQIVQSITKLHCFLNLHLQILSCRQIDIWENSKAHNSVKFILIVICQLSMVSLSMVNNLSRLEVNISNNNKVLHKANNTSMLSLKTALLECLINTRPESVFTNHSSRHS